MSCRNYGKDLDPCMNYITSLEEERRIRIEEFASKDMKSCDADYNKGEREVKCNNL